MADLIEEDQKIRTAIKKKLHRAGISRVEIERAANRVRVVIHSARPGIIIGRGGTGIDALKKELDALTGRQIMLSVNEVRRPEIEAQLVAENVAQQLERRIAYRRAMKQAVQRSLRAGAKGIQILPEGRRHEPEHRRPPRPEGAGGGPVVIPTRTAPVSVRRRGTDVDAQADQVS
jgi:small subunit ribosomal protein S3